MWLSELFESPRDAVLARLEQTVNNGSPSGFTTRFTTSQETSPGWNKVNSFYLPAIALEDSTSIADYGTVPVGLLQPDHFFLHPDMLEQQALGRVESRVLTYPTSSARTVLLEGEDSHFVKVAYRGLIGRTPRDLGYREARSSIEVSRIIESALARGVIDAPLHVLREVFARVVSSQGESYAWGFIARESTPFPRPAQEYRLVPAFSLFAKDRAAPTDPCLLTQLVELSGLDPVEYVFENLIGPLLDCYFQLITRCGLQLEAHAQNMLFILAQDASVIGVVARDAESIDKDLDLIRELDLETIVHELDWKCLRRTQYNYRIMHSFMYDFKLGEYLLEPIIKVVVQGSSGAAESLRTAIRERARSYIRELPKDFFPVGEWFYYANEVHERSNRRPYLTSSNLKFRD